MCIHPMIHCALFSIETACRSTMRTRHLSANDLFAIHFLQYCGFTRSCSKTLCIRHKCERKPRKAGNLKMAFSCQPDHCSAYANDLCWRMVRQREALGYTYDKIASPLFGEQYSCFSQQAMLLKGLILRKEHTEY